MDLESRLESQSHSSRETQRHVSELTESKSQLNSLKDQLFEQSHLLSKISEAEDLVQKYKVKTLEMKSKIKVKKKWTCTYSPYHLFSSHKSIFSVPFTCNDSK